MGRKKKWQITYEITHYSKKKGSYTKTHRHLSGIESLEEGLKLLQEISPKEKIYDNLDGSYSIKKRALLYPTFYTLK